jgi:hypothetical protein
MEKQIQAKATDFEKIVKEQRAELEKESGNQSSTKNRTLSNTLLKYCERLINIG